MLSLDLFLTEPKKYKHIIDIEYPLECDNCKELKKSIESLQMRLFTKNDIEIKQPSIMEGWYR